MKGEKTEEKKEKEKKKNEGRKRKKKKEKKEKNMCLVYSNGRQTQARKFLEVFDLEIAAREHILCKRTHSM